MLTNVRWMSGLLALTVAIPVWAADSENSIEERSDKEDKGYRLQILDDPVLPLEPAVPRTEKTQARVDAMSWYMTGRLRSLRGDQSAALEAFIKAVDLDDKAIQVYDVLIPLAYNLQQKETATKYALKAIQADPGNYRVLRRLAIVMAGEEADIDRAVELLNAALESPSLKPNSPYFVTLKLDLGLIFKMTGEKEKAADCYEVVFDARMQPDKYQLSFKLRDELGKRVTSSYERIGEVFLDAKRIELAIRAFEQAAREQKGKPGVLSYNLASVYVQTGEYDKALTELQKYLDAELQTKGKQAYALLAKILEEKGLSEELLPRLEALLEKDRRNRPLQLYLAEQYLAADKVSMAEDLFKKLLAGSSDVEAQLGLVGVYRKQLRSEDIISSLAKIFVRASRDAELQRSLQLEMKSISEDEKLMDAIISTGTKLSAPDVGKLEFLQSYLLARICMEAKRFEAVVQFYGVAIKQRREQAGSFYNELGEYLFQQNQYKLVAEVYQDAVDTPTLVRQKHIFLYFMARALEMTGKTDDALKANAEARELRPEIAGFHFQHGWIYYHAHKFDKAIELFEAFIKKFPSEKDIVHQCKFSLSNIYVQKGELRKGEQILEEVYEEAPDLPSVNNDLGYLYADQGKNLEKAEKMIRKALAAEPENAAYLDSMGWVLYKLGKYEEAVTHLEKAASKPFGQDPTILDHLADCYDKLAKKDKAKELWKKALESGRKEKNPDKKLLETIEKKLEE